MYGTHFFLVDNDKKCLILQKKKNDNVHVKPGSLLNKVKNIKFERLFDGFELLLNNIYCNYIVCSMANIYFIGTCI